MLSETINCNNNSLTASVFELFDLKEYLMADIVKSPHLQFTDRMIIVTSGADVNIHVVTKDDIQSETRIQEKALKQFNNIFMAIYKGLLNKEDELFFYRKITYGTRPQSRYFSYFSKSAFAVCKDPNVCFAVPS